MLCIFSRKNFEFIFFATTIKDEIQFCFWKCVYKFYVIKSSFSLMEFLNWDNYLRGVNEAISGRQRGTF